MWSDVTLEAGGWVHVKQHQRKNLLTPQWKGPFQVLLTSQMAENMEGTKAWIHVARCKSSILSRRELALSQKRGMVQSRLFPSRSNMDWEIGEHTPLKLMLKRK